MLRRKQVQTRATFRRHHPTLHPRFRCLRPLLLIPLAPYRLSLHLHPAFIPAPVWLLILIRQQEVIIFERDQL